MRTKADFYLPSAALGASMTLTPDEFRRVEYLLEQNRNTPLSMTAGDELRLLLTAEDASATLMEWVELVKFGEMIVRNRGFVR